MKGSRQYTPPTPPQSVAKPQQGTKERNGPDGMAAETERTVLHGDLSLETPRQRSGRTTSDKIDMTLKLPRLHSPGCRSSNPHLDKRVQARLPANAFLMAVEGQHVLACSLRRAGLQAPYPGDCLLQVFHLALRDAVRSSFCQGRHYPIVKPRSLRHRSQAVDAFPRVPDSGTKPLAERTVGQQIMGHVRRRL